MKNNMPYYPDTLTNLPNWILWKLEIVKGRTTKVPYTSRVYNKKAQTNNPESWDIFKNVEYALEITGNDFNGLGFVITLESGIIFIDIDHCIDENGNFNELANDIISALGSCSFIEYSQSGTGLHLFTRGVIPKSYKRSDIGLEIYCDKRFCAMTGNAYNYNDIGCNQEALTMIYEKYKKPEKPKKKNVTASIDMASGKTVDYIIDKLMKNEKTYHLMNGDISDFPSHSEADFYFCTQIAFWCDRDASTIDEVFKKSGLYREKWDREDYKTNTIERACNGCDESISEYIIGKRLERFNEYESYLSKYYD